MNSNKPTLLEIIKQFSGWIIGTVTLLTTLIGFAILFRDNPQLTTILIIVTLSIAVMFVCLWVIIDKTPPAFIGGRETPTYSSFLRVSAFLGLILILILNILFFISSSGRQVANFALYGTSTPLPSTTTYTATSANTPTPLIPAETPLPLVNTLIKTDSFRFVNECGHTQPRILPEDMDLTKNPFGSAQKIYKSQELVDEDAVSKYEYLENSIWFNWEKYDNSKETARVDIYNIQSSGTASVKVDKKINIVIDEYESLPHINVANLFPFYLPNCGGGSGISSYPVVMDSVGNFISTSLSDYDFFTLQPGEIEELLIPMSCAQSGKYTYHIELNASYFGGRDTISSQPLIFYCPSSYTLWTFTDAVITNGEVEIRSIGRSGEYTFGQGEYSKTSYGSIITKPWAPCLDAPESYIYPRMDEFPNSVTINSKLNFDFFIYEDAGLDKPTLESVKSGGVLTINDKQPKCLDNMVWWNVGWNSKEQNTYRYGWVAEANTKERFLISCFENPNCDTSGE
jgi:hypothetical protein